MVSSIWVDTDLGFDDLWALTLLHYLDIDVAGVSLVHGNAELAQVVGNAEAAREAFGFQWPLYLGADRPMQQTLQTAEAVLGPTGMRTRGRTLPVSTQPVGALPAWPSVRAWLTSSTVDTHHMLALGPLTNLANWFLSDPEAFLGIDRITWMGGSTGRGNQTRWAEFNAYADPEALDVVLRSGVPLDVVDLELCRQVTFGEEHMPSPVPDDPPAQLMFDLLGGYLDIARSRGRDAMNIYDPVAVVALAGLAGVVRTSGRLDVHAGHGEKRGQTVFAPVACRSADTEEPTVSARHRLITAVDAEAAREVCLKALESVRGVAT